MQRNRNKAGSEALGFTGAGTTFALMTAIGVAFATGTPISFRNPILYANSGLLPATRVMFQFGSMNQLGLCMLILYKFRLFERTHGPWKHLAKVLFYISVAAGTGAALLSRQLLPLGHAVYVLIFAFFVDFLACVPTPNKIKGFTYAMGAALLALDRQSWPSAATGLVLGALTRYSPLGQYIKFPKALINFLQKMNQRMTGKRIGGVRIEISPAAAAFMHDNLMVPTALTGADAKVQQPQQPPQHAQPMPVPVQVEVDETKVSELLMMGFEEMRIREVLAQCQNNVLIATNKLLEG
jgi:hypothetical protein